MRPSIAILLLLLCLPAFSAASSTSSRAGVYETSTTYAVPDSLPTDHVELMHGPGGYLWLSTCEGIARFDGVHFNVFTTLNTPGLPANNVGRMQVDIDGNLWILASTTLTRLRDGRFQDFTPSLAKMGDGSVRSIVLSSDRHLLVGCDHTFYRYDGDRFQLLASAPSVYRNGRTWSTFRQGLDGSLWISGSGLVCHIVDGKTTVVPVEGVRGVDDRVYVEGIDGRGHIWISSRAGLFEYSGETLKSRSPTAALGGVPGYLRVDATGDIWFIAGGRVYRSVNGVMQVVPGPTRVNRLDIDRDGRIWAIVDTASISTVYAFSNGRFTAFDVNGVVSEGWDVPIVMDEAGDVWTCTAKGIVCIRQTACHTVGTDAGFPPGKSLTSTFCDRSGRIWIGTDGGGLGQLVDGVFRPCLAQELRSGSITSIAQTDDGALWIGRDGALFRFDGHAAVNKTKLLSLAPLDKGVSGLCTDHDGRLFVGTDRSIVIISPAGVDRLSPGNGLPANYTRAEAIVRGRGSHVFLGYYCGLLRFDHGRLAEDYPKETGLPSPEVIDVHEDVDGGIWLATWGTGLYRIKGKTWTHIDRRNGLYADNIHQIQEDAQGNLWIGSAKGIFRVRRSDLIAYADGIRKSFDCVPYGPADGASAGECWAGSQPSAMKTPEGTVWFACHGGVVACRMVGRDRAAPQVLIEDVVANHVPSTSAGAAVDVAPGPGTLEFHYTGLDFYAPESLRFRYRLVGLDDGWQSVGTRRTAFYTNVEPGNYTFVVSACNARGVWGKEVNVRVRMEPHFYQRVWFRVLLGGLSLLAVFVAFDYRHRRTLARNRELEVAVADATQELRETHAQVVEQNDELQSMHAELEAQNEELVSTQLELEKQNEKLESLATSDGLTGLKNHRAFHDRLTVAWAEAERYGTPLSVILLDVDKFKQYNDTYGHPSGDEVLKRVGQILSATARETDFVARYGGEEFVIVLPHTDANAALEAAERCRAAIEAADWPQRAVTASFGVSTHLADLPAGPLPHGKGSKTEGMSGPAELVQLADGALYASKGGGRNRVTHAHDVDNASDHGAQAA